MKSQRYPLIFVLSLFLSSPAVSDTMSADNLLLDPGFESGVLQQPFTAAYNGTLTIDGSALAGNHALRFTASGDLAFTQPWRTDTGAAVLPLDVDETLTFSAWVRSEPAGRPVRLRIFCLDDTYEPGTFVSAQETFLAVTEWSKISLSHTCPAAAGFASVRLQVDEAGTSTWWDSLRLEREDPSSNLIPNGGFENADERPPFELGQNADLAIDDTVALSGRHSLRLTSQTTDAYTRPWRKSSEAAVFALDQANETFEFSAWAMADAANTPIQMRLFCLGSDYDLAGMPTGLLSTTASTGWQRFSLTHSCPAGASFLSVRLDVDEANRIVWWDDVRLEPIAGQLNFIFDPGFEGDSMSPPFLTATGGTLALDSAVALTGSASLRLEASQDNAITQPWRKQAPAAVIPLSGSGRFNFSAWAKADGPNVPVSIHVLCLDEGYDSIRYPSANASANIGTTWQQLSTTVDCPAGADFLGIRLDAEQANTTVWWDDLELSPEGAWDRADDDGEFIVGTDLDFEGARGLVNSNSFFSDTKIDNVNTMNGNLVIQVPIGQSFQIGPDLQYGLSLTYNSNAWDTISELDDYDYQKAHTFTAPHFGTNAGLGWQISLGMIYINGTELGGTQADWPNRSDGIRWLYVAPDGTTVYFNGKNSSAPFFYSSDGHHLRLRENGGELILEFPDGKIHTFQQDNNSTSCPEPGGCFRPTRMEDKFANFVNIAYNDAPGNLSWALTDIDGRVTTVSFTDNPLVTGDNQEVGDLKYVVDEIHIPTFGGGHGIYTFEYDTGEVGRACPQPDLFDKPIITLPKLTKINMPEASYSYDFTYDGFVPVPSGSCSPISGLIESVRLPSNSRIEYEYDTNYRLPMSCTTAGSEDFEEAEIVKSTGIRRRTVYQNDSDGDPTWQTFHQRLTARQPNWSNTLSGCNRHNLSITDVVSYPDINPSNDPNIQEIYRITRHYHTVTRTMKNLPVAGDPSEGDWRLEDYGLSVSKMHHKDNEFGQRIYLSQEIAGCPDPTVFCSNIERRVYQRYAVKSDPNATENLDAADTFRDEAVVTAQRSEFGAKYIDTRFEDYDGYGHFERSTTRSNIDHNSINPEKKTLTDYDLTSIPLTIMNGEITSPLPVPPTSAPWLLNLYSRREERLDNRTSAQEFNFDPNTGFLNCQRTLASTAQIPGRSSKDLTTALYEDVRGFTAKEQYAGGDHTSHQVPTSSICPAIDAMVQEYRLHHEYAFGQRRFSEYEGNISPPLLDATIDRHTGLVATSIDYVASPVLVRSANYDKFGRLTLAQVTGGGGTLTTTTLNYQLAPSGAGGGDITYRLTADNDEVNVLKFYQDGLGREYRVEAKVENNQTIKRNRIFRPQGLPARTSTFRLASDPTPGLDHFLKYKEYDIHGRIREIEEPFDEVDSTGGPITKINYLQGRIDTETIERYYLDRTKKTTRLLDAYGRIWKEKQGIDSQSGSPTRILETYWNGERTKNTMVDGSNSSTQQVREQWTDGRGFTYKETLPEKDGDLTYTYDSRGNLLSKSDGGVTISNIYDDAGRLTSVFQDGAPLKSFSYDNNGRIATAVRHNHLDLANTFGFSSFFGGTLDATVTEVFAYNNQGLPASKTTTIQSGANTFRQATQGWKYDKAGRVTEIDYGSCTGCNPGAPLRKISRQYDHGRLLNIEEVPGSPSDFRINHSYHPNGLPSWISYDRGGQLDSTDRIDTGYNNLRRFKGLKVFGNDGSELVRTGRYYYNGVGNISKIVHELDNFQLTYSYDILERLTRFQNSSSNEDISYGYDVFDNLETPEDTSPTVIDQTNNRLLYVSGETVDYDQRGNMLGFGCKHASFDGLNQQIAWACYTGSVAPPNTPLNDFFSQNLYIYNASDQRVWTLDRTRNDDPADQSQDYSVDLFMIRDLDGQILREYRNEEIDLTTTHYKDYIWSGRSLRALIDDDTVDGTERLRFAHLDHLGSVRMLSIGSALEGEHFRPFGTKYATRQEQRIGFAGHELNRNAINFDHERDGAGTTYDMKAREYWPGLGRFMSVDPAKDGWNLYAYVGNNPINRIDPTGLASEGDSDLRLEDLARDPLYQASVDVAIIAVGVENPLAGVALGLLAIGDQTFRAKTGKSPGAAFVEIKYLPGQTVGRTARFGMRNLPVQAARKKLEVEQELFADGIGNLMKEFSDGLEGGLSDEDLQSLSVELEGAMRLFGEIDRQLNPLDTPEAQN